MSPRRLGLLLTVITAVLYGFYPSAIRTVYAEGGNTVFVILATTFTRMLVLLGFTHYAGQRIFQTKTDVRNAITGGFLQALTIIGIFASLVYLPGPLVIIIVFTHTLMLLFYMAARGEMKLTANALFASVVALLGLSFVLDIWHPQSLNWIGIGLAFASALGTGARMYFYGHLTRSRPPAVVGAESFIVACLLVLLCLTVQMPTLPHTPAALAWAVAGCLSIGLATLSMLYALSLLGTFQTSLLAKMEPLFTAIFAALLIGELLKPTQYAGMALVLASLAAYQWIDHRKQKAVAV